MTQALSPNAPLIGQAGSRYRPDTPALLIDLDALERNIAAMAAHARAVSVALRPHVKTHKSVRIARMQVDAGAIGICCATLGEAEVTVDAGIPGARQVSRVGRQISSHKHLCSTKLASIRSCF
jgi:3-hydroxy-D-aspartate aldolase